MLTLTAVASALLALVLGYALQVEPPASIPVELVQLLGLIFGTTMLTSVLKAVAAKLDMRLKGWGAVALSALVAVALTGIALLFGWYPVDIPEFTGNPLEYGQQWVLAAGGVTALANLLYVYVYERMGGSSPS